MREIKYRGYCKEKFLKGSQWVEDGYGVVNIDYVNGKRDTFLITPYGNYEVYEESVGQYTGLKDKNEKGIYEGDILHVIKVNSDLVLDEYNAVVRWEDYGFVANSIGKVNNDTWLCAYDGNLECSQIEIEVVGNIYENSELLKE